MNAAELKAFIRQISKEKELDIAVVKEAIEQAIISASKKNLSQFTDARPDLDAETGQLHLYVKKTVANIASNPRTHVSLREAKHIKSDVQVGDLIEVEIDPSAFGRIAAQSARQVVMQKLRDAERVKVYDEFQGRVGELISGTVLRFEKRDVILSAGRAEALLPRNEIPPTSHYRVGDRLKAYVLEIDPNAKGPIIRVSRTHPQLVAKLFEQEVPEIADGTVKIANVVREPGARAKIAVQSTNSDVDPVGACVGVKGSRVQMIVRELENEKVDIVPYSSNLRQFITNALVPAQIQSIQTNDQTKQAEVIVKKGNLSLAIGKKGQNAKLAAKLTGWKLDIHSEAEEGKSDTDNEEIQRKYVEDLLNQIERVDDGVRQILEESGYNTVDRIAGADRGELGDLLGGDFELADELVDGSAEYMEALREMTRSEYGDDMPEVREEQAQAPVEPPSPPVSEESEEEAEPEKE